MLACTKRYADIPFAHRAPKHDGHCRFIHGHNWTFDISFTAEQTDDCGFIVDFGKLHNLRDALYSMFDHSLVLNHDDPLGAELESFLNARGIGNVVRIPDCSSEGIALFVFGMADSIVRQQTNDRARVFCVIVYEDSKNKATYASQ